MTEDHCTFAPGWLDALRAGLHAGHAIVGGPVENGLVDRTYDGALYLCEYAAHMPPVAGGSVPALSGVTPPTSAARSSPAARCGGRPSTRTRHDALRGRGRPLPQRGGGRRQPPCPPLRAAAAHLFRGGRRFGRHRRAGVSPAVRAVLPVGALAPARPPDVAGPCARSRRAARGASPPRSAGWATWWR
jgi:hypothetical protein